MRQTKARDMLRGDLEGPDLDDYVESRVLTTTLERAQNWARGNSLFPATFGLACCAIEMIAMVSARYDTSRFGSEVFRASPRQADMLILSGRVSIKMVPVIRRILRPDAGAEVGDRDGGLLVLGRDVRQLRGRPGGATSSSRSTCTYPAARRVRRR